MDLTFSNGIKSETLFWFFFTAGRLARWLTWWTLWSFVSSLHTHTHTLFYLFKEPSDIICCYGIFISLIILMLEEFIQMEKINTNHFYSFFFFCQLHSYRLKYSWFSREWTWSKIFFLPYMLANLLSTNSKVKRKNREIFFILEKRNHFLQRSCM